MTKRVMLSHGGGGRASRLLVGDEILSRFKTAVLADLPDAAMLKHSDSEILFSTDSFVVSPLFFPGGDIGKLSVFGTANDLAVCGGIPRWLSLGLIVEEGLEFDVLRRVLDSIRDAADSCGVEIVTGDTKVVPRGQCDGLYISTAGIGERIPGFSLGVKTIEVGDAVLVSGTLGDHAMAVLATRKELKLKDGPQSDCGPVQRLVQAVGELSSQVRFMRDPTRGGLAAVLNEVVEGRLFGIEIVEENIPFSSRTRAVAEMLGLDLLQAACEGRVVVVCSSGAAERILAKWRVLPEGQGAVCIGHVTAESGRVVMDTLAGGRRLVDLPEGELLPRIC